MEFSPELLWGLKELGQSVPNIIFKFRTNRALKILSERVDYLYSLHQSTDSHPELITSETEDNLPITVPVQTIRPQKMCRIDIYNCPQIEDEKSILDSSNQIEIKLAPQRYLLENCSPYKFTLPSDLDYVAYITRKSSHPEGLLYFNINSSNDQKYNREFGVRLPKQTNRVKPVIVIITSIEGDINVTVTSDSNPVNSYF